MRPFFNKMSLTRAAVQSDDMACMALVMDAFAYQFEDPHAAIYTLTPALGTELSFVDFEVSDLTWARDGRRVVAIGHYGEAVVFEDGTAGPLETINGTENPVRGVAEVDNDVVACGGNLAAYRRNEDGTWTEFGPGPELQVEFPQNHLEAIDGFAKDEIYAAGRDGVIWWFDGTVWSPVQCATNLAFTCVHCAEDGYVYAGGMTGIVAKGRRDEFLVSAPPAPLQDIWGILEFQGVIYCAMMRALMTWNDEDGLAPALEAMTLASSFYNLGRGPQKMWSLGDKDVLTFDGASWTRINQVGVA
ncbi:hypothetical protein [uncultured Shimia sp.]|uniref:hypothetical protein n=1 Tax=uncultured Shimia sp. TaxID=573152 RepID=UPI0025D79B76|nr:hypothetical protein [uncultured Shimia sp.]